MNQDCAAHQGKPTFTERGLSVAFSAPVLSFDVLPEPQSQYVSRGGLKLEHALRVFDLDVTGLICADFGCSTGGFTDCLLQHGATKVQSIDTGYGVLAWKLRQDARVVVSERTNVLHATPPERGEVDLVVIDLGWTPQRLSIPAALRWLGPDGRIVSLVKPHYELTDAQKSMLLRKGTLSEEDAGTVLRRTLESMPAFGLEVLEHTRSPLRGGKSSRRSPGGGNVEYFIFGHPIGPSGVGDSDALRLQ